MNRKKKFYKKHKQLQIKAIKKTAKLMINDQIREIKTLRRCLHKHAGDADYRIDDIPGWIKNERVDKNKWSKLIYSNDKKLVRVTKALDVDKLLHCIIPCMMPKKKESKGHVW